jgi:hypothetical protein
VQNVARSTFWDRFLLKYKQISLAAVDCAHFKRKRSQKTIMHATFCTEWKSALTFPKWERPASLSLILSATQA